MSNVVFFKDFLLHYDAPTKTNDCLRRYCLDCMLNFINGGLGTITD